MSTYQYTISSFECQFFSGPGSDSSPSATITGPLSNSGRSFNLGFYDLNREQLPNNKYVSGICYATFTSDMLAAVLESLRAGGVGFEMSIDTGEVRMGFNKN